MTKPRAGALALVLALSLAPSLSGCSTIQEGLFSSGTTAMQRRATGTPATATTASTATRPPMAVDQSTPEAAMTSWLRAMVAGDGKAVCALMAADGRPVAALEGATANCAETVDPLLSSLRELDGMFQDLSIAGATVVDDLATFEAANTRPALAAQVIHRFKALRIQDKWYITE